MNRRDSATPNPLLQPIGRSGGGSKWLVIPGWQQSAAHWTPLARWTSRAGTTLLVFDVAAAAATATAARGTFERLEQMTDLMSGESGSATATILVGHSAGAPLAVLAAAKMPGVTAVVLVDPVASQLGVVPPQPRNGADAGEAGPVSLQQLYPMAGTVTIRMIEAAMGRPTEAMRWPGPPPRAEGERRAALMRVVLEKVEVPVLVVRGRASALLSEADARILSGAARRGRALTIPDAGHSPHIDRPRETAAALLDFAAALGGLPETEGAVHG